MRLAGTDLVLRLGLEHEHNGRPRMDSQPDDEDAAAAFALGTAAQGNVRSVTMRAWDPEDFAAILGMMP